MMIEEWRNVAGYEGMYLVSNMGDIKSKRTGKNIFQGHTGRSGKYKSVSLSKDGKKKTIKVHKIVCESFKGKAPDGYEIDHVNGVHHDNRICNLEYVTPLNNKLRHSYRMACHDNRKGSSLDISNGKYKTCISHKNKTVHLISSSSIKLCSYIYKCAIRSIITGEFDRYMARLKEYRASDNMKLDEMILQ